MQVLIQEVLLAFLAAFSFSAVLTPIFRKIAISLNIVDVPNQEHKTHARPIPYLGGLSIVITVSIGLLLVFLLKRDYLTEPLEILVLFAAPLCLSIVGLVDDLKNLGVVPRLFIQSVLALTVSLFFIKFGWFGEPTDSQALNALVTIVWIVAITNALNFIDNLDGGAGGVAVVISITLSLASIAGDQFALAAIAVTIAGASFGFLIWNLYPARIYLGDSGSLFLGCILAVLTIRLDPATPDPLSGWFFAVMLFAVPILDTSVAVISRLLRGVSPFEGGRDHLAHILLGKGLSKSLSALAIWTLQLFYSALSLALLATNLQESRIILLISTMSWLILLIYFLRISSRSTKHNSNYKYQSP